MYAVDLTKIGRQILEARGLAAQIEPPSRSHPGFAMADGYEVGRLLHDKREASGARQVGAKLGFTNQSVWDQLGMDTPFWAPIYDTTVTGGSSTISLTGLVQPRIEPEIILGFKSGLAPGASLQEITSALGWTAAGFEIVQCHYPQWDMTPADAVADVGLHAILAVGQHVSTDTAHASELENLEVALWHSDRLLSRGHSSLALGGPIQAIAWLLRLPGVQGLRAGDIVTTGTLTTAHPIEPGQTWRLVTTGALELPNVTVHFDHE